MAIPSRTTNSTVIQLSRPETHQLSPQHRREPTADWVFCMERLLLNPTPLASTHNAQLFRAHVVDATPLVVVKTSPLLTPRRIRSPCDDPVRELRAAVRITERGGHPNVVGFLGAFLQNDSTHLVMEHCSGGDLFSRLQQSSGRCLPEHEALDVILQVARGLQFLHQCNIAHRDVSVENVLIAPGDVYKLCDFGLCTQANGVSTVTVGKTLYMAPEIVSNVPYNPVRADVWSLGIVLFILLTGSPLVKLASTEANDFKAFGVLGSRGVLELWKMDGLFSKATVDLLDGMLQINPRDRFQNMSEVLDHPALLGAATRRLIAQDMANLQ